MDPQLEEKVVQFVNVTGASSKDARKYLEQYGRRVDHAIDAYYNQPVSSRRESTGPSTSKLSQLFDHYKDPDGDDITVDGTIKLCEDLSVDPEDVVLLAVAYELKSPAMGTWERKTWIEGWKTIGCDSIATMKTSLLRLRDRLGSDAKYFQKVYNYAFEFSRPPGQRSLGLDMAEGFWQLLIPHGLQGGALSHIVSAPSRDGEDTRMGEEEEGWKDEYTQWWFDYLQQKGVKGVSKDVWQMFLEFVRAIDSKFEKHDLEAAWPSTIDEFVEYARKRLAKAT